MSLNRNVQIYNYKILIPHQYLYVNNSEELYEKLMNDQLLNIKEHNNCLPLEFDCSYEGLTNDVEMYIILGENYSIQDHIH